MRLVRTEYWNPSTGTVRTGSTGHGESLADVETYLLPLTGALLGEAFGSGVAQGLEVSATAGQQGLTVNTGLAVDGNGQPIVLSDDGAAVVDPDAPAGQVQNVPLVLVSSGGVELPTSGLTGAQVLTAAAREALDGTAGAAAWSLVHAPWLQLVPQATFTDDGTRVPLALVTLDATGAVTALDAGPRRQVSPAVGSLTLRRTTVASGQTPSVGAVAGPSLQSRQDGGLDVVLPGSQAAALSVEGSAGNLLARGNVGIGTTAPIASLEVDRGTATTLGLKLSASGPGWGAGLQLGNQGATGRTYGTYAGDDGRWHFVDVSQGQDRLVVDAAGHVGIGTGTDPLATALHVTGSVHSGGADAGLSFMDRQVPGYVNAPTTGQRWVWYADGGYARLWSGTDQLSVGGPADGGGLDVPRRMRVRQGADLSAGIWFWQNGAPDIAFVGMADDSHVGLWGQGVGWGLTMDVGSGALSARGLTLPAGGTIQSEGRLHVTGPELLYLLNHDGVIIGKEWGGTGDLTVEGTLRTSTNVTLPAQSIIAGDGRLHITGGETLYLLNHNGVIIGKEWGGTGDLTVEGTLRTSTNVTLPAQSIIAGDGRLHITGGETLYLLNHNGVIIGKEWGGTGNLTVEGPQLVTAGAVPLPAWSGGGVSTWDVFAAGGVYVGDPDNASCWMKPDGSKHFVINHPLDPENRSLDHVCIEGPEAAVYYRGSAGSPAVAPRWSCRSTSRRSPVSRTARCCSPRCATTTNRWRCSPSHRCETAGSPSASRTGPTRGSASTGRSRRSARMWSGSWWSR